MFRLVEWTPMGRLSDWFACSQRGRPIQNLSQLAAESKAGGYQGKLVRMSHAKALRREGSRVFTTKDTKGTKQENQLFRRTRFVSFVPFVVQFNSSLRLRGFA
jgi:hypothetical protein